MEGDWYCKQCGYLSASRVTNAETCDTCHTPVVWHEVGVTQEHIDACLAAIGDLDVSKVKDLLDAVRELAKAIPNDPYKWLSQRQQEARSFAEHAVQDAAEDLALSIRAAKGGTDGQ